MSSIRSHSPFNLETKSILQLSIKSATALPKTDLFNNNIDPYIVVLYGPLTYQSKVFHEVGSNPVFDVTFQFPNLRMSKMTVLLYDHDYFRTEDDFLGKAEISVHNFATSLNTSNGLCAPNNSTQSSHVAELTSWDGTQTDATLCFSIEIMTAGHWPKPSLQVICHNKKIPGLLKWFETLNFKGHKLWEISLMVSRS